jgi:hypothetical protein
MEDIYNDPRLRELEFRKESKFTRTPGARAYHYDDQTIGETTWDDRYNEKFTPFVTESELHDILNDMPLRDKVHLGRYARGVEVLMDHYELRIDDQISDEDILIFASDRGYSSLTELGQGDKKLWGMVKERNLEDRLFSAFDKSTDSSLGDGPYDIWEGDFLEYDEQSL